MNILYFIKKQPLFYKVQNKFREFRVLVFGPIPQGQNAELDFAEKNSASSASSAGSALWTWPLSLRQREADEFQRSRPLFQKIFLCYLLPPFEDWILVPNF